MRTLIRPLMPLRKKETRKKEKDENLHFISGHEQIELKVKAKLVCGMACIREMEKRNEGNKLMFILQKK